MVYKDGELAEQFFKQFLLNNGIKEDKIILKHSPFDYVINSQYVEVKSTKLYIKQSNKTKKYAHGQYECWDKKQLNKLKRFNVWVCFIIQHDKEFIIHGFTKSKNIPNKRKMSLASIQNIPLSNKKQFLNYIKQEKNKK